MMLNYETFELLIGQKNQQGYPITLVQSPSGDASTISLLDPQDPEFQDALQALEMGDTDHDFLIELGNFLYSELFVGDIATRYRESLSAVRTQNKGLRVRLRIEPQELAPLPWEYLYDGEEDSFLSIAQETALVRYLPARISARPTQSSLPLRILVVIANPTDLVPLDVNQEKRIIQDALAEREAQGQVKLLFVERATVENVAQAMRTFQPHVFHFVGHGQFENDTASVILEDETGRAKLINERTFREFFSASQETRLAVLNACQSATLSASQPLVGLAPRLLQRKLSATIAMQYPISDRASLIFAREFYRTLAAGAPVEAAMAQARKGIYQDSDGQSNEWGTPVLFLRAKDGQLIEWVEETAPDTVQIPAPPEPRRPVRLTNFVGRSQELAYYNQILQEKGFVLINGMAGVGKSTLAAQLAHLCGAQDQALWYQFEPGDSMLSFIWQLAGFLAWNGQTELWQMLHRALQSDHQLPPPNVLADYVMQLLRTGDYLICLDDFHVVYDHIDEDPILGQFMERLDAIVAEGHVQLIVASRTATAFAKRYPDDPLHGLSLLDATDLLQNNGVQLSVELIQVLHTQTEGNPQLLMLAAQALNHREQPERLIRNLAHHPQIDSYLLQEVDVHLTPKQQKVMQAVALFQEHSTTRDAIESVLNGDNVRRTLSTLTRRHLLIQRQGEVESEYTQHAIVQDFYYDLMGKGEREAMHQQAALYYECQEAQWLHAASHYLQAGLAPQAAALLTPNVQALINQGQVTKLRTLLSQLKEHDLEPLVWIDVNIARGEVDTFLRYSEAAKGYFEIALSLLEMQPQSDEVRRRQAAVCQGMGNVLKHEDSQQALYWLTQGLDFHGNMNSIESLYLKLKSSTVLIALARYDEAHREAQTVLDLLPLTEYELRIGALINLGTIYTIRSDFVQGSEFFQKALTLSQKTHNDFCSITILRNLAFVEYASGQWYTANHYYQLALALAEKLGDIANQLNLYNGMGMLQTRLGNHKRALSYLNRAVALVRKAQLQEDLIYILSSLATLYIERADWVMAIKCLHEAESLAADQKLHYVSVEINTNWSKIYLAKSQIHQAINHINKVLGLARKLQMSLEEGVALRILGQIYAAAEQEITIVTDYFQKSLDMLINLDRYETARTQTAWGEWLWHYNQDQAQTLLQNAYATFQTLGAAHDLAYVERLQRNVVAKG